MLVGLLLSGSMASAPAQPAPTPVQTKMTFDFANPALTPAAYRIEFDSTGLGHYHSEPGTIGAPNAQGSLPEAFDQQIQISVPLREQLLAVSRSHRFLVGECESRQHKVAFTGRKTLSYQGPEGGASCTFNWSQDAQLMKVASDFLAIALTLEEGRKLRLAYLHDRLSLDAELETLSNAVKLGNALELENIAPELEAIAADPAVMKRAQARAAALLAVVPPSGDATPGQSR
jgi:hypothetical protein